ncbi:MAG: hypothetical protein H0W20_05730 [Chthoniobacterales bacterium]|nr:hypothetical protein [Chthoniobacterales bacterium]
MEDGVRNRGGDADHPELAHAFGAEQVHHFVVFFNEQRLNLVHVGLTGTIAKERLRA